VRFNFGSTGQLTQQIEQGAPVDLIAAADSLSIDQLERGGLILHGTRTLYGRGRLTLWTRNDSKLELKTLNDLRQPGVRRIAIANPQHAPYGAAAREALQTLDLWTRLEPRLVFGENIRQTLQYAETGNVDVAVAALSLSIGSEGKWSLVPEELHRPLDQTLAIVKGTRNEAGAREFSAFVTGEGRSVMRKYGFWPPGEGPP
jgi:molybdate transport system substrate-binding protein